MADTGNQLYLFPPEETKASEDQDEPPVKAPTSIWVFIGAKNKESLLCVDDFRARGIEPILSTDDGSVGIRGTVVDALNAIFEEVKP